jgi:hypothetical protein
MLVARGLSLSALMVIATIWAACMVVPGVWLLLEGPSLWPRFVVPCVLGGVSAMSAGTFVFLVLVIGRMFPDMSKRAEMWAIEMLVFLIFVVGGLGSLLMALRAGSEGIA